MGSRDVHLDVDTKTYLENELCICDQGSSWPKRGRMDGWREEHTVSIIEEDIST